MLRLGGGGGDISGSILGGHKTLFLTNSLKCFEKTFPCSAVPVLPH